MKDVGGVDVFESAENLIQEVTHMVVTELLCL